MESESTGIETTATSPEGSSSPETQSVAETQSEPAQHDANAAVGQEKPTPFHEHPRFKELVEQKNQFSTKYSDLESKYQKMEQRMQQIMQEREAAKPKQEDPLLARLKQIDPEFGNRFEKLSGIEKEVEQFKQFQEQMRMEQARTTAETKLNSLYEQNKVPDNLKTFYRQHIENMAYNNPKASLNDLENYFKSAHETYTKFIDEFRRQERASYVTDKKKDITPATQTGGAPASISRGEGPKSIDDVKAAILNRAIQSKQKI